jgi:diadenylate cyclase
MSPFPRSLLELTHLDQFGWIDLLDVLLLAVIIYYLLLLIRGTRAVQMLAGVLALVIAYWLSGLSEGLRLRAVHRVLGSFLFYVPFAVIVIFQDTIRRALAGLARNPFRLLHPPLTDSMMQDLALAAVTLADHRHGALIVVEREQGLGEQAETGIRVDAALSYDLLINIFAPHTPLHDGAVIVADGRVKAAACFLPLGGSGALSRELGTRHRAALGITEQTDALALVVSEETGIISLCENGRLRRGLDARGVRDALRERLGRQRVVRAASGPPPPGRTAGGD